MVAEGGPGDNGAVRKGQARKGIGTTRERERERERERGGGDGGGGKTERNRSCALCIFIRPGERGGAGRGTAPLVHANRQLGYSRRGEVARLGLNPCEISRPPSRPLGDSSEIFIRGGNKARANSPGVRLERAL
jgi:hypothetical protein